MSNVQPVGRRWSVSCCGSLRPLTMCSMHCSMRSRYRQCCGITLSVHELSIYFSCTVSATVARHAWTRLLASCLRTGGQQRHNSSCMRATCTCPPSAVRYNCSSPLRAAMGYALAPADSRTTSITFPAMTQKHYYLLYNGTLRLIRRHHQTASHHKAHGILLLLPPLVPLELSHRSFYHKVEVQKAMGRCSAAGGRRLHRSCRSQVRVVAHPGQVVGRLPHAVARVAVEEVVLAAGRETIGDDRSGRPAQVKERERRCSRYRCARFNTPQLAAAQSPTLQYVCAHAADAALHYAAPHAPLLGGPAPHPCPPRPRPRSPARRLTRWCRP